MVAWTPERIAEARRLWEEGYSASLIADELGEGLTKNAVIGRANRGQWGQRRPAYARPGTPEGWMRPQDKPRSHTPRSLPPVPEPPRKPGPYTLLELFPHECKWPMNAPERGGEYLFCGAASFNGFPYCETHAALGFSGKGTARPTAKAGWMPKPVHF